MTETAYHKARVLSATPHSRDEKYGKAPALDSVMEKGKVETTRAPLQASLAGSARPWKVGKKRDENGATGGS